MSTPWILLDSAVSFRISGRDARRYLHNRLTQDIRGLGVGQTALAAALTAQGRVEGLFVVLCQADDAFLMVSDGGDPGVLHGVLKRFVVADRVVCEDVSHEVHVVHIAVDAQQAFERIRAVGIESIVSRRHPRIAGSGVDLLCTGVDRGDLKRRLAGVLGEQLTPAQYDYARWEKGFAEFPEEINEQGMLLEFGLRDAVSFTKGCYVGQEVIERSDAIGRIPRRLERVVLTGAAEVGQGSTITTLSGDTLGKVVRAMPVLERDTTYLFALLSAGKYKDGDEVRCSERSGVIVASDIGAA